MEWTPGGESQDIEDRRGDSGGGGGGGGSYGFGGGGGGGFGGMHLGIGGTLLLIVLSLVFKTNMFNFVGGGGGSVAPVQAPRTAPLRNGPAGTDTLSRNANEQREVQLVSFVLDDVQHTWERLLPQEAQKPYRHAKLVLFRNRFPSACGTADTATGPFYCPGDEKVYIDLAFYDELKTRFGAPGEFAQAYVLAHEIGHHVQKILGIEAKVRQLQQQNPSEENPLSVRLELQADCFAGVWGHTAQDRHIIDTNDIAAGMNAAAAVGDDRLQKEATGRVNPETFTHGSSADRQKWFKAGLTSGNISSCNTFAR
jgi:predicted metalloprotease